MKSYLKKSKNICIKFVLKVRLVEEGVCLRESGGGALSEIPCFQNGLKYPWNSTGFILRVKLWKVVMKRKCFKQASQET